MKKIRFVFIFIMLLFSFILTGCDFFNEDELGENEVKVLNSESTFVGKDYEDVVSKLQDWGFINIETVAVYDIFWGITKPGTTKTVSIDGSRDFKSGSIFYKDVTIIITYSMPMDDDPAKQKHRITWQYEDGTIIKTDDVLVGTMPSYTGTTPSKESIGDKKYTFSGWTPEIVVVSEAKIYTAVFIEEELNFTITFNLDGGEWSLNNTQTIAWNDLITSEIPTKTGFIFDGWVIRGFFTDTKFDSLTTVQKDYTLTATWTTKKYTVVFDLDGGTWSRENEQLVDYNKTITTSKPTKSGYEFVGWMLDGEEFDSSTQVKTYLSLKAIWYQPNFEEILVGRWDGSLGLNKGHLKFIEFSGVYYDSDGERKSTLIDDDYDVVEFTLNGNKLGINYSNVGMVWYTITYTNGRLGLEAPGTYKYTLSKTNDESNSPSYKWGRLLKFAKTQSSLKIDELGYYYEIIIDSTIRNLSPNNKLVESNRQVIKVYLDKFIGIDLYYVGVNDSTIDMTVTFALNYENVINKTISNPYILIVSEGYVMQSIKGTTKIEFNRELNQFFFTTTTAEIYVNSFPTPSALYEIMLFTEKALYVAADYLLSEHGIYLFTT